MKLVDTRRSPSLGVLKKYPLTHQDYPVGVIVIKQIGASTILLMTLVKYLTIFTIQGITFTKSLWPIGRK
jgi:hypothetical protein